MIILLDFAVDMIHDYFTNQIYLSELDSIKLKYILKVILNELSKLIILFFIFFIVNNGVNYIYCLISLIPLRTYTGGMHYKTYAGCLIFSGIFIYISIFLSNYLSINYFTAMIQFIFSLLIVITLAPIISKNRPIYNRRKKIYFKLISIFIVLFHFTAYFSAKNNPYFTQSIWVITLQSIQLIVTKGGLLYENSKNILNKGN